MSHLVIVCIDDHPMFLQGLAEVLNQLPNVQSVYTYNSYNGTILNIQAINPHICFIDLKLKDGDGLDLCRAIKLIHPETFTVALTAHDESLTKHMLSNGFDAFFSKSTDVDIIELFVSSFDNQRVENSIQNKSNTLSTYTSNYTLIEKLTVKEKQLMHLEAKGLKRSVILKELSISVHTYKSHINNIKAKLNLKNISSIISFASRHFPID